MNRPVTRAVFVTGTDTGVGKTLIASALLLALARRGLKAIGMKPVASGCTWTPDGLRNADALALMTHSSITAPYELVNPYAFAPAIAPHIAAAEAGILIQLTALTAAYRQLSGHADVVVAEGAGGWLTPLDSQSTLADFAVAIGADVVLTVGLRLGCINHALLTARAIQAAGLQLIGWVANSIPHEDARGEFQPAMRRAIENIRSIEERLAAPLLGVIPCDSRLTPVQVEKLLSLPACAVPIRPADRLS